MPFIMLATLIDMVAIGIIIPVLPALVGSFTESQRDQAFWYGVVTFAFGFTNFFGSPILGTLSDAYGRRPVLLIGFCGLALTFILTGLATSLAMLIVVRAGVVRRNVLGELRRVLDSVPTAKLGFVLTGADIEDGYGYGAGYGYTSAPKAEPRTQERVRT